MKHYQKEIGQAISQINKTLPREYEDSEEWREMLTDDIIQTLEHSKDLFEQLDCYIQNIKINYPSID